MVCYKNVVVAGLKALQDAERKSDAPTRGFKVRAYQTAIAAVAKMAGNLERPEQLDGLLTKTMARKARAMMEAAPTPVTPEAGGCDDVAGIEAAMELLKQVAGIGPVAARKLAVEHGVRTLEELRARQDELKLNQKQRLGLLHHVDINQRIPRTEMDAHAQILLQAAKKAGLGAEVVGSYRRGAESSGDVDVLLTWRAGAKRGVRDAVTAQAALSDMVSALEAQGYLERNNFARGKV